MDQTNRVNENVRPVPASYYYLWHLAALGILDADFGPIPAATPGASESAVLSEPKPQIRGTVWDQIALAASGEIHPARVAIIDVGVSRKHPNLRTRIDADVSLDLTTHRYGARTTITPGGDGSSPEEKHAFFSELDISNLGDIGLTSNEQDVLNDLVAEYAASKGVLRNLIGESETFASHGTSIAGLIVGEPAAIAADGDSRPDALPPEMAFSADAASPEINPDQNLLPYFGADPFSRIISIRTSFEDDATQFIAAFLYAWMKQVDVIVLPRGLPDPTRSRLEPKNELEGELEAWENRARANLFARLAVSEQNGFDTKAPQLGAHPDRLWNILRCLITGISKHIPVICAAGNDGESQLIYPANLADRENGIIAVGAVTPEGFRSGYSNYGEGLTLVAPSDDVEVYNRHQLRIDRLSPFINNHHYEAGTGIEYAYSHLSLMTTDLPGTFGYEAGSEPWSAILPYESNPGVGGGYYTSFGGTSGACALVGGVAALVQRANRARHGVDAKLDGLALKEILNEACSLDAIVQPGYRPLTPDSMNLEGEDALSRAYFFGAGLLSAAKAVDAVLST